MSDPRDTLKTMLQDLINDRTEQAEVTIHNYLVAKTQAIAGFGTTTEDSINDEVTQE